MSHPDLSAYASLDPLYFEPFPLAELMVAASAYGDGLLGPLMPLFRAARAYPQHYAARIARRSRVLRVTFNEPPEWHSDPDGPVYQRVKESIYVLERREQVDGFDQRQRYVERYVDGWNEALALRDPRPDLDIPEMRARARLWLRRHRQRHPSVVTGKTPTNDRQERAERQLFRAVAGLKVQELRLRGETPERLNPKAVREAVGEYLVEARVGVIVGMLIEEVALDRGWSAGRGNHDKNWEGGPAANFTQADFAGWATGVVGASWDIVRSAVMVHPITAPAFLAGSGRGRKGGAYPAVLDALRGHAKKRHSKRLLERRVLGSSPGSLSLKARAITEKGPRRRGRRSGGG